MDEIHSQDSSDFTVLVKFDAFVTDNFILERFDEDLILDMYVFGTPKLFAKFNQMPLAMGKRAIWTKLFTNGSL